MNVRWLLKDILFLRSRAYHLLLYVALLVQKERFLGERCPRSTLLELLNRFGSGVDYVCHYRHLHGLTDQILALVASRLR